MAKIIDFGKKFGKAIAFGAVGVSALGVAISSVLKPKQDEDDYDDYESEATEDSEGDTASDDSGDESEPE